MLRCDLRARAYSSGTATGWPTASLLSSATIGLGFGLLSAQLRPGETDWTRAYDETVRLAVEAERLGFTSVWTTEVEFLELGADARRRGAAMEEILGPG